MVTNPKQVNEKELLAMFDKSVRKNLKAFMDNPDDTAIVVFDNLQMDSSQFGARTAMVVGKYRTYKDLQVALAGRLGDVPSRFQYPVAYWSKE